MKDSVTREYLASVLEKVSAAKEDFLEQQLKTGDLDENSKEDFLRILNSLYKKLGRKDALKKEIDVFRRTSFNEAEFLRNVDYIERILEETIEDLDDYGYSIWLASGYKEEPKEDRIAKSNKGFFPKWLTKEIKPLWEKALKKLDDENAVLYEDGSFNYKGALANFITLLEDYLDRALDDYDSL